MAAGMAPSCGAGFKLLEHRRRRKYILVMTSAVLNNYALIGYYQRMAG